MTVTFKVYNFGSQNTGEMFYQVFVRIT